ncbi:hypothetical protein [Enterococcus cecorum]|uniref:hypothetical protein n=1 Tax=Enterococcus cecorum TaxID=44008 RepID=UPI001FAC6BA4|nr:hypothetical protein [Enterococcus cecorum]
MEVSQCGHPRMLSYHNQQKLQGADVGVSTHGFENRVSQIQKIFPTLSLERRYIPKTSIHF